MENIIFGIRPVAEAIEAGKQIEKLYIRKGAEGALMTELRDLCFRHRIRVQEVPWRRLPPSSMSSSTTFWSGCPTTRRRWWSSSTG